MKKILTLFIIFCVFSGCSSQDNKPEQNKLDLNQITKHTECPEERTRTCTREYRPVCATKDNGVRCITTPCDSTDQVTYPNACTACSDQSVYSHIPGECK